MNQLGQKPSNFVHRFFQLLRSPAKFLLLIVGIAAGLFIADSLVSKTGSDWRYMEKLLYYQDSDLDVFMPDPNPDLVFRLKPSSFLSDPFEMKVNISDQRTYTFKPWSVHINSLGVRGLERTEKKEKGVFRILCFGGSNVYGDLLSDDETWPAQLEKRLNQSSQTNFEVWNLGVKAYVPSQMAILAEEAVTKYDPDLVIYAISNRGSYAFTPQTSIKKYFEENPDRWSLLIPKSIVRFVPFLNYEQVVHLFQKSRFFRMAVLGVSAATGDKISWRSRHTMEEWEKNNAEYSKKLFRQHKDKVRLCIFLCPVVNQMEIHDYLLEPEYPPVIKIKADSKPEEFRWIHPPPYVMTWYAEKLSSKLKGIGLIP